MCSAPKPLIWWTSTLKCCEFRYLWNTFRLRSLGGFDFWKSLKQFDKNLSNKGYKMQKQMCSFLFPPANNHDIFCVTQIQLYRVGKWQFGYFYLQVILSKKQQPKKTTTFFLYFFIWLTDRFRNKQYHHQCYTLKLLTSYKEPTSLN